MKFKGKVDWWFHAVAIAVAVLLLPIVVRAYSERNAVALAIALPVLLAVEALCVSIELRNYVQLHEKGIIIYFGFARKAIPYSEIDSLRLTRNPAASLAASRDRIAIRRRGKPALMIAVHGKDRFFREVRKRAPNIVIL